MPGYDPDYEAMQKDAEKWRDRATAEGAYTDPKAEETLRLLAELARLRVVEAEYEAVIQQQQAEVRLEGDAPSGVSGPFTVELSGDFDETWSHMFADDEGFIRISLHDAHGDEMRQLVHRLEEENTDLCESLTMIRDAWNFHFKTCPVPMPEIVPPTAEQIQAWMHAPSATASALPRCPENDPLCDGRTVVPPDSPGLAYPCPARPVTSDGIEYDPDDPGDGRDLRGGRTL